MVQAMWRPLQRGRMLSIRRLSAVPAVQRIFEAYPHIGKVLPAVGYDPIQLTALQATINDAAAELVVFASPVDLGVSSAQEEGGQCAL